MDLKILQREESLEYIQDKIFINAWDELAKKSQCFTLIQEPDLVVSWYEAYKSHYKPLIVVAYNNEALIGLLPLAISLNDGGISHAGHEQAEYNGWVCDKEHEEDFLINSLVSLRDEFSLTKWDWGWLPPHANTNWIDSDKLKKHGIYVNKCTFESPVYDLHDEARITKIKKSKSTKSKINRLKRSGELKIERITDVKSAKEAFVELKKIANFRNLAVYDNMPFVGENSDKENWHLNHLDGSDSVHFTVLWLGDELLACNFGFCTADTVIIGLFTYNPVQGAHSPGNVFLIELIDFMKEEGFRYLDLSPGGDPYKERFSNTHITLTKPIFCFNKACKIKTNAVIYLKNRIKEKYSYRDIMSFKSKVEGKLKEVIKLPVRTTQKGSDLFHYNLEKTENSDIIFRVQKYDDLLLYKYEEGMIKHKDVIFSALKNFERGDLLYTLIENDELIFSVWVSETSKRHWNKNIDSHTSVIQNSTLIYDLSASNPGTALLSDFASKIYTDKVINAKCSDLYMVKPTDMDSEQIETIGFNLVNLS